MQRWHGTGEVPAGWGPSVVTIGNFDGVHVGHQSVVARAGELAREHGAASVVVTFDPHPLAVLRPDLAPPLLTTLPRKLDLLEETGADATLVLPFDPDRARQSAEDFVTDVLVTRLRAVAVVVGENFRFGHRAAGDLALLAEVGQRFGFTAEGDPLVAADGRAVSSSRIRALLDEGDVEAAAAELGRPHRVEGVVVKGEQRGRELGYPTANLASPADTALPADGVYAGWLVRADGDRLPAAISVGTNPTFAEEPRRAEAYVLDRTDLELYGERVGVDLTARLRPMLRFDGVPALLAQMALDVDQARQLLVPEVRAAD